MIKFDLLCTVILAYLIAVAHTQSDDCQVCTDAFSPILICTGATDISQLEYLSDEILAPCECNQDFINGYARCPYCSSSGVSASNFNVILSICQQYGYSVKNPSSTKNNGSNSGSTKNNGKSSGSSKTSSSTSTNGSSSGSTKNNGSSSGSSKKSASTGNKGAIIGISSGSAIGLTAAALGIYCLKIKKRNEKERQVQEQQVQINQSS
ncbi:10981_t:CDS:2 [Ambispora gerdemannii]|uniref:10981_t:CDS:1 n=1 Tax=Ambispora gerdemannii TaxID=144530 RepID=A0A9N8VQV0_9GLOM|nr:10981_t:CDS:2 [Ambispora gerdemannii]